MASVLLRKYSSFILRTIYTKKAAVGGLIKIIKV